MAIFCGCDIGPGKLFTPEMLVAHYAHTLQTMFVWDLAVGDIPQDDPRRVRVMELRCQYQKALEERFPQLKGV